MAMCEASVSSSIASVATCTGTHERPAGHCGQRPPPTNPQMSAEFVYPAPPPESELSDEDVPLLFNDAPLSEVIHARADPSPPRTESRLPRRRQYRTCMRSCPTTT